MTTTPLGNDLRRTRPSISTVVDHLRTRFAASLAERRAERRFRTQQRAFAGMDGAQRGEILLAARRS